MMDRAVDPTQEAPEKDDFMGPWILSAPATIGYALIQGQKLRRQLSEMDLAAAGLGSMVVAGRLVPMTPGQLGVALLQDPVVDSLADDGQLAIQTPFVADDKQLDAAAPVPRSPDQ